jgi:RNA recognition motif-containing protein
MNIYIGNLSPNTTENEIRQEFTTFGIVGSIIITNDNYIGSGQPRRYGYVEMGSPSEGRAAVVGLKGLVINNREINIVEALPMDRPKGSSSTKRFKRVRERSY